MRAAALRKDFETTHLAPEAGGLSFAEKVRALLDHLSEEEWDVIGRRMGFLHSLEETRALFGSAPSIRARRPALEILFVEQAKREAGLG